MQPAHEKYRRRHSAPSAPYSVTYAVVPDLCPLNLAKFLECSLWSAMVVLFIPIRVQCCPIAKKKKVQGRAAWKIMFRNRFSLRPLAYPRALIYDDVSRSSGTVLLLFSRRIFFSFFLSLLFFMPPGRGPRSGQRPSGVGRWGGHTRSNKSHSMIGQPFTLRMTSRRWRIRKKLFVVARGARPTFAITPLSVTAFAVALTGC